ncbi:MAG: 30S ribosomal protein S6e [Candidatus Aenigmarchaeota archaeon]|nr:30S ribosomal protein S6e [Candidatus Aenigmarchaeota archaeon]
MAIFKIVVSDPKSKRAGQFDVDQSKASTLVGKRIGDEFDGGLVGFAGYTLRIRGGTDKDGFAMHSDMQGAGRKKALLSGKPCFYPEIKGQRKRKTVCGSTVSESIVQINTVVEKYGEKPFEELVPKKEKPAAAEAAPEEKAA